MNNGVITKIVSGDGVRKTRLHDEKGNLIDLVKLIKHGPPAFATGAMRVAFGFRPKLPWISYAAISHLAKHLNKNRSRVLEFGSGMSTLWFSDHAKEVCSVEDYEPWFQKVQRQIGKSAAKNINYQYARSDEEYSRFMESDNRGFDLIMVDGSCRSACVERSSSKLRPGGIIYLDNTDKDSSGNGGDMRIAETKLRALASSRGAQVVEYTDFAPTQLFVQQGMCVTFP